MTVRRRAAGDRGDGVERSDVHERDRQVQEQVAQDRAADRGEDTDEDRGHGGQAGGERLGRADRAEQADRQGVEHVDERTAAGDQAFEQHPEQGGGGGDDAGTSCC